MRKINYYPHTLPHRRVSLGWPQMLLHGSTLGTGVSSMGNYAYASIALNLGGGDEGSRIAQIKLDTFEKVGDHLLLPINVNTDSNNGHWASTVGVDKYGYVIAHYFGHSNQMSWKFQRSVAPHDISQMVDIPSIGSGRTEYRRMFHDPYTGDMWMASRRDGYLMNVYKWNAEDQVFELKVRGQGSGNNRWGYGGHCGFGPDGTIYVTTEFTAPNSPRRDVGLIKSVDGGTTWTNMLGAPIPNAIVTGPNHTSVAFPAANSDVRNVRLSSVAVGKNNTPIVFAAWHGPTGEDPWVGRMATWNGAAYDVQDTMPENDHGVWMGVTTQVMDDAQGNIFISSGPWIFRTSDNGYTWDVREVVDPSDQEYWNGYLDRRSVYEDGTIRVMPIPTQTLEAELYEIDAYGWGYEQAEPEEAVIHLMTQPTGETIRLDVEGALGPQPPTTAPTVTLTPISQTRIDFSLSAVSGAIGYEYRVGTSGSWIGLGTTRTGSITGLNPGQSYTIQARAYNNDGAGPVGSATASTLPQPQPPTTAPNVDLTPVSQTRIDVSLSQVSGATGYEYRIGTSGSWTDLGTSRTASLTGLSVGTSYTVQARAYNADGAGPVGTATASTLEPDPVAPTTAPNVSLTPIYQSQINLSLSIVADATGYRYRVGTSGSWIDLGTTRTAQITGLTPGTSYTVQARAYNAVGDGPIESATASTLAPAENRPPVFQTSPPTQVRAGQVYRYDGVVTDPDGDDVTVTLVDAPGWLDLTDHGDGTFTLTGTAPEE